MISKNDIPFLNIAKEISFLSTYPRVKIGCCLVKNGNVLSVGNNCTKSHPVQKKHNRNLPYSMKNNYLHAEINTILKCNCDISGATLYIFRLGRDNILRECKPCPSCMSLIKQSRIKRIVHTTTNGIKEIRTNGI